ncbi:MAG TPA: hypothetical protein VIL85_23895, partial [Thermomicrobiales bacterium]
RRNFIAQIARFSLVSLALPTSLAACTARSTQPTAPPAVAPPASATAAAQTALVAPTLRATTTRAALGDRPPIIFVHRNGNASSLWHTTIWRFESNGWPRDRLFALDFPYPTARDDDSVAQAGRSGSDEQRGQHLAVVDSVVARTGADKVVLIGSSRGGNAIRNLLKNGGGAPRVSHAVLCGTPNHGAYVRTGDRNEFNGAGPFLQGLNAGSEVVPDVAFLTIRSDTNDFYAQPGGGGYDGPALNGATNIILPGVDHNETATSARAFVEIYRFLTGQSPTADIVPEATVELNGRVTGFDGTTPTNLAVGGVTFTIYELDPLTGARRGAAQHARTTDALGSWGPFVTRPDTYHEFVVAAPGQPVRHFFRSPFPRSSAYVNVRLWLDTALPDQGLVVFTRPRGYLAGGRDTALLDGKPIAGLKVGLPTEGTFRIPLAGPERAVTAALNGEAMTIRCIPSAITYAEFHF